MSQRAGSVKLGSRRRWCMVRSPPLDDDSSACSFRVRLAGSDRTIAPAGLMCGRRCPLSDGPNTTTTTTGVVRWRAVDYRSADDPARGRRRREKVTFGLDTASASGVGKRRDARAAGPAPGVWGSERDDFWNPSWVRLCLLVGGFKVFFFSARKVWVFFLSRWVASAWQGLWAEAASGSINTKNFVGQEAEGSSNLSGCGGSE